MAYTLIDSVEIGAGGAAAIEFTGIAQETGADLRLVLSLRSDAGGYDENIQIQFNSDAGTNYNRNRVAGSGGSVSGGQNSGITYIPSVVNGAGSTADTFCSQEILISEYASTSDKIVSINNVTENRATSAAQQITGASYSNATGITSIKIFHSGTQVFVQNSTASLYLVTSANASGATPVLINPKATGGTITLNNGYWYHSFTSSGTFTPSETLTSDYLIVAGGGGACGGSGEGQGGGGAGGYRSFTSQSLSATAYSITVGAGNANADGLAPNGADSSAFSYTSTGGGGASGAYRAEQAGVPSSGGSGAGGGGFRNKTGAAGIAGQGNAGGSSGGGNQYGAGGGGGAGAVGGNGVNATGGGGGNGLTWLNGTTYAGGGGGQGGGATSGGTGGGGNGGSQTSQGGSGSANTGGGGGGSGGGFTGGAGGSGVVIVRYAA